MLYFAYLTFLVFVYTAKFIKVHPRERGAWGGRCHDLYALSATPHRKSIAVINYWMTLPHADANKQWFTIHKHVFENPKHTHISVSWFRQLDSKVPQCFLCSFFQRSAFCQWFCSLSFTRGGLDCWLKGLLRCVWQSLVFCMPVSRSSYLSHEERRRPIPASTRAGSERSARQWSNWALHTQTPM